MLCSTWNSVSVIATPDLLAMSFREDRVAVLQNYYVKDVALDYSQPTEHFTSRFDNQLHQIVMGPPSVNVTIHATAQIVEFRDRMPDLRIADDMTVRELLKVIHEKFKVREG